jgi:exosortase E/protease (VPEID-CTERM system)
MTWAYESLDDATPPRTWYRSVVALAVIAFDAAAILLLYRFDAIGAFGNNADASCTLAGIDFRICNLFEGKGVPRSLFFSIAVMASILALGLYDPRPLLYRFEHNVRSPWWLALNAGGAFVIVSPYLLIAAGVPSRELAPWTPFILAGGAALAATGLSMWLCSARELVSIVRPHQVLLVIALFVLPFAATRIGSLGWAVSFLQTTTLRTAAFLLELMGQQVVVRPGDAILGIDDFEVVIYYPCSGIEGIAMVCAVAAGYVLALRRQLWVMRALLLIPFAAALSWMLNGVRIAALMMIGAKISPDLAINGFHTYAGWIAFAISSALILYALHGIAWIHRDARPKTAAIPVLSDPVAGQIAPFIALLASSLLTSAFFTNPETGYPLRFALVAAVLLLFRKAYRRDSWHLSGLPVLAGALVAAVWLHATPAGAPQSAADILGSAEPASTALWVLLRVAGTVLLIPLVEEMFFRGYLLNRLDFGGFSGKAAALVLSSVAFGALHSDTLLATGCGFVFGLLALRKGRVSDAVAAHATANALIALWALWTGDWSVIR